MRTFQLPRVCFQEMYSMYDNSVFIALFLKPILVLFGFIDNIF